MSSATTRACKKIMSDTQVYSKEKNVSWLLSKS
jgi:hypothetical protein